jgi:hypothetical protein
MREQSYCVFSVYFLCRNLQRGAIFSLAVREKKKPPRRLKLKHFNGFLLVRVTGFEPAAS